MSSDLPILEAGEEPIDDVPRTVLITGASGNLGRKLRAAWDQVYDLVLIDRGFWSYKLFWQIQQRQAFFVIRLRQQVRPQTVRVLAPGERLVCWQPAPRSIR